MSTANKQPYARFFASDWLGGTRGMRAAEVGVYITLIALMYERCEPIPEDHRRLARQCGCTPQAFATILDVLVDEGKIERRDGGLWNKRVQKEFEWRAENSQAAREAASARWGKNKENNAPDMHTQCERNASGMPSQKPEARSQTDANASVERARRAPPKPSITLCPADWAPSEEQRSRLKAEGFTDAAIEAAAREMADWAIANGKRKADWEAAHRNWVRRNAAAPQGTGPPPKRDSEPWFRKALTEINADERIIDLPPESYRRRA